MAMLLFASSSPNGSFALAQAHATSHAPTCSLSFLHEPVVPILLPRKPCPPCQFFLSLGSIKEHLFFSVKGWGAKRKNEKGWISQLREEGISWQRGREKEQFRLELKKLKKESEKAAWLASSLREWGKSVLLGLRVCSGRKKKRVGVLGRKQKRVENAREGCTLYSRELCSSYDLESIYGCFASRGCISIL